jgi:uncharacterized repeat protein (TIGR01451 family)
MRRILSRRRTIACYLASSFLLFPWLTAPVGLTTRAPRAYAQAGTPDILGTYQGELTDTDVCEGVPATGMAAATVSILTQQGQSFTGTVANTDDTVSISIDGTVDASGQVTGTYSYQIPAADETGSGTFTGQVTGNQIQLSLTGTNSEPGQTCNESITITATGQTLTSDLSIAGTGSPTQVASGAQISYSLTVSNAGPDNATGVVVTFPTPAGTTAAAAAASQGQVQGFAPGSAGNVVFSLGTVAGGAAATVSLTANVLAAGGSVVVASASVMSSSTDPNLANNMVTISTPVVGGGVLELVWDQPAPTAADPTPPPDDLRVVLVAPAGAALRSGPVTPQGSCTLVDVNVYLSDQTPVQTIPGNLWETVPPDVLQTTMAAKPAGSFYVITNVWNCGGMIMESGPSNEASVPPGPTISRLEVTGKLKAMGTGFSGPVQVLVNGVGFKKEAVLKGTTTVVQKGKLTDGTAIGSIGATASALVTIVNEDGGIGTFAYKKP